MNLLVLGRHKTAALAAQIACERGHCVRVLTSRSNANLVDLSGAVLSFADVVVDLTTPDAVLHHVTACVRAGKNMVVGTNGWYRDLSRVREAVDRSGIGILYGVNPSFVPRIATRSPQTATVLKPALAGPTLSLTNGCSRKEPQPGTAVMVRRILTENSGLNLQITAIRQTAVIGMCQVVFASEKDTMVLTRNPMSLRGFAEGAVRGAEWIHGRRGFYAFRDVLHQA